MNLRTVEINLIYSKIKSSFAEFVVSVYSCFSLGAIRQGSLQNLFGLLSQIDEEGDFYPIVERGRRSCE